MKYDLDNFIFPAICPEFAIYGWTHSTNIKLYPNQDDDKNEIVEKLLEEMKQRDMISHCEVNSIEIEYSAATKWSHIAEIRMEFKNPAPM